MVAHESGTVVMKAQATGEQVALLSSLGHKHHHHNHATFNENTTTVIKYDSENVSEKEKQPLMSYSHQRTASTGSEESDSLLNVPNPINCSETNGLPQVESWLSLQGEVEEDGFAALKSGKAQHLSATALRRKQLWPRIETSAIQFGLRMAILLTLCGLLVLIRTNSFNYPDAMWVLISVLFVCWFPSLDAASVIEKIMQRLIGTFIGAFLGLSCGFISLWIFHSNNDFYQSIFLSVCMFVFNFLIIFLAGQWKVGGTKVMVRFSYATILCVLTFCICMLPFAYDDEPKWYHGVIRIVNVVVGCLVGALGSILICPKSTTDVLYEKTARQVRLAGEASEALLQTASDHFAGLVPVSRLADEILRQPLESSMRWKFRRSNSGLSDDSAYMKVDIALKKYEDAIMDWRATKALFPLAQFDPFHVNVGINDPIKSKKIQTEIARTLARALRIQTTIVVLDGMIRNDADYDFSHEQLQLFSQTGALIKKMLAVPFELTETNQAAKELFLILPKVRKDIYRMSAQVADVIETSDTVREKCVQDFQENLLLDIRDDSVNHFESSHHEVDDEGRGIPKDATGRHDNTLFFLQLVEHLILRSLRLYQAWKHVEVKATLR